MVVDNGAASRLGIGAAYFIQPTSAPLICARRMPLTPRKVNVERLGAGGGNFDIGRWVGIGTVRHDVSGEGGRLTSTQPGGSIY
jgi:hypothetical protein